MILIEEKAYLYLMALVPFMFFIYSGYSLWKKKARLKFAQYQMFKKLSPQRSSAKAWTKVVILSVAVASMVIALANIKMGTKMETVKREGVDIVFAMDVSKSMLAEDVRPSRMEKAQKIVSEIINKLTGDRVGIVAYAADAYPQLPLTSDYSVAKMFLSNLNTNMLSSQGTAIDQAIRVGEGYFEQNSRTAKIMFIVSDGEDHEMGSDSSEVITKAQEKGIKIFTIGVGTTTGAPIPVEEAGAKILKRDQSGEVVITKLNKDLLQSIAQQTNGQYTDGENVTQVVQKVEKWLEKIEKNEYEAQTISDYKSQFQWFVALAIALLLIDIFVSYKKSKLLEKIKLFEK